MLAISGAVSAQLDVIVLRVSGVQRGALVLFSLGSLKFDISLKRAPRALARLVGGCSFFLLYPR